MVLFLHKSTGIKHPIKHPRLLLRKVRLLRIFRILPEHGMQCWNITSRIPIRRLVSRERIIRPLTYHIHHYSCHETGWVFVLSADRHNLSKHPQGGKSSDPADDGKKTWNWSSGRTIWFFRKTMSLLWGACTRISSRPLLQPFQKKSDFWNVYPSTICSQSLSYPNFFFM